VAVSNKVRSWGAVIAVVIAAVIAVVVVLIVSQDSDTAPSAQNPAADTPAPPPSATTRPPAVNPPAPMRPEQATQQPAPTTRAPHRVQYSVAGAGRGEISYNSDGKSAIEREPGAQLPWAKEFTWPQDEPVKAAHVSVTVPDGEVTCTVKVDGVVAKTVTAKGSNATASCDATLGLFAR
jgi:hypothetical protein